MICEDAGRVDVTMASDGEVGDDRPLGVDGAGVQ
jgi:hypothetical protein